MESILDFSKPLDLNVFDSIVNIFNNPSNPQRSEAERVLTAFKQNPASWTYAPQILESDKGLVTKYLALQILDDVIVYRWKSLPLNERDGIRNYVLGKIMDTLKVSSTSSEAAVFLKKINMLLVNILKHDWPERWPNFMEDLLNVSKTDEALCENNIVIIRLLWEESFDFSRDSMLTSLKADSIRKQLSSDFERIFDLCMFALSRSTKPSLIKATLRTLQRVINWIPDPFVFESPLLPGLCSSFFRKPEYQVDTLLVLTEVASKSNQLYESTFVNVYREIINHIVSIVPSHTDLKQAYPGYKEEQQNFIRHLALFLTSFFKEHATSLENPENAPLLTAGIEYLIKISDIDDPEIFKICIDYWHQLSEELFRESTQVASAINGSAVNALVAPPGSLNAAMASTSALSSQLNAKKRLPYHSETLMRVREIFITHMAKPAEVLLEENESGEVVRAETKDTDNLAVYSVMHETLVFLTHLDPQETEQIMLSRLVEVVKSPSWSRDALNTLCWAIGSISGTLDEQREKTFVVSVIKDLLTMCETASGKSNKAVIASNIMYVVGQYTRFLRQHWKFLRTVVLKLFEFMLELHPGVQEMAVDTFLKIAQNPRIKGKFINSQENGPVFFDTMCDMLPETTRYLEFHHTLVFYEAAGHMISAHKQVEMRYSYMEKLMRTSNARWFEVLKNVGQNFEYLKNIEVLQELTKILRLNTAVCRSALGSFEKQLALLYKDLLRLYTTVSNLYGLLNDPRCLTPTSRAIMAVKREILNLISTYAENGDLNFLIKDVIPPLFEPVLSDYSSSPPAMRLPEVLNFLVAIIGKLKSDILPFTLRIVESVFQPTLEMIAENLVDFPELKKSFFKLLGSINEHCFSVISQVPRESQKLLVDSLVWALKHTDREIGEVGLVTLAKLFTNFSNTPTAASQFFFFDNTLGLTSSILEVLTDRLHKVHFKNHVSILQLIFGLVNGGTITAPLWEHMSAASVGLQEKWMQIAQQKQEVGIVKLNTMFFADYCKTVIGNAFQNLTAAQVDEFVMGLFDVNRDIKLYRDHVRDFLVRILESQGDIASADSLLNEESRIAKEQALVAAQRSIPGMVNPEDLEEL